MAAIDTADTGNPVNSLVLPRENSMAEPEWRRVAEEIRQRIRDDRVIVKDDGTRKLPKYPHLQAEHHTSYGTVRSVLMVLEAEGWIIRRPGVEISVREDHPK